VLRSDVPVIAVTANARNERVEFVTPQGMDEVVTKPFRIPMLLAKMRDVVCTVLGEDLENVQDG
jgi:CheY-like chemotaxis protein